MIYRIFYLLSLLPLRVLYGFSDVLSFLAYYIVRYRRKIVRQNLTTSFPEKILKEIKTIEKRFYRWFTDYFFEAIKLLSLFCSVILSSTIAIFIFCCTP